MTVSYWGGATLEVSVAFDKGANETVADGDYTDVSAYVRGMVEIQRGRSSELDTFQTGTATITLANTDRRFDPEHSAGPYYGKLLPNRHVRIRLTYGGNTSFLFKGYVGGWQQQWPSEAADRDATCTIVCHDWFKLAARTLLPSSAWAYTIANASPYAWWRFDDGAVGTQLTDASGNNRHGTYASAIAVRTPAGSLVTNDSNGAMTIGYVSATVPFVRIPYATTGTAWSFEWWAALTLIGTSTPQTHTFLLQTDATGTNSVSVTFSIETGSSIYATVAIDGTTYFQSSYNCGRHIDGLRHHFALTRTGSTVAFYVDGVAIAGESVIGSVTAGDTTLGTFIDVQTTASTYRDVVDELVLFTSALSAATVLAHYAAGSTLYEGETTTARLDRVLDYTAYASYPTSFATGYATCAPLNIEGVTLLAYLQQVEQAEGGNARLFVAADGTLTFQHRYHDTGTSVDTAYTDASGTTLPYAEVVPEYDDSRIYNDVSITRAGGNAQRVTDTTSRTAYGNITLSQDGLILETDALALDRANGYLYAYKNPLPRVRSLTVYPRSNPLTLYPKMRTTEIGTKVTIRRHPMKVGSAYTRTLTVEGVAHSIGVDGTWRAEWLTAPADNADDWLRLDSATQGLLDTNRLGF